MSKIIIGIIAVFCLVFFGIKIFSSTPKLELTKAVGYASVYTLLTTIVIASIIILF